MSEFLFVWNESVNSSQKIDNDILPNEEFIDARE